MFKNLRLKYLNDKRERRREELKERLREAATERIRQYGLQELRARDVTSDAGCALGALYNAYRDMDELVLAVNAATLRRLGAMLNDPLNSVADPQERLIALAKHYVHFARDNMNLWSAIFDHRMQGGRPIPDWYNEEQKTLFVSVGEPLRALLPQMDAGALDIRVRTVFAAVHGVVQIGLREKIMGFSAQMVESEVEALIRLMVRGATAGEETS
jgi:AcrR family transcriptional regulator